MPLQRLPGEVQLGYIKSGLASTVCIGSSSKHKAKRRVQHARKALRSLPILINQLTSFVCEGVGVRKGVWRQDCGGVQVS